ncbi:MAG: thioesterase-like protein [Alphaproteobacteria bacterium]|nr:thioesterase-like protein [Alphaproteobacteria bacterium]
MAEPLAPVIETVRKEWIDSFGHLNMAYYVLAFDSATYAFWNHVTRARPQPERDVMAYAVVEAHVNYLREVSLGQTLRITTQVVDVDGKRFRLFHDMHQVEEGYLAATNEVLGLGFNLATRGVAAFTAPVFAEIETILKIHSSLPIPRQAGRAIAIPRKP